MKDFGKSHTSYHQMLLTMKLTIILMTVALLQAHAGAFSQKVTITGSNLTLKEVFSAIGKQAGYNFFYEHDLLNNAKNVTLHVKDGSVEEVLALCFEDQPLTYSIEKKTVFISARRKDVPKSLSGEPAPPPAQADSTHPISGRIQDTDGKPLSDATVAIKKTKTYTSTRPDGLFTLNVHEGDVLTVTFVGFTSREIKVTADLFDRKQGNVLPITLSRSTNEMDQAQVTAYGTTTRRLNAGDITTITSEEIEKSPVNNVLEAIQGKVPGLFIQQATGQPGGAFTINIREAQNLSNASIPPLIIVDGVRYPGNSLPMYIGNVGSNPLAAPGGGVGNGLNYINPNDIASIDVLKDADATAIYGTAGAYGVILITTKKAQAGAPALNANVYTGISVLGEEPKLMNTQQYVMLREEALKNDGLTAGSTDLDVNGTWPTNQSTDWRKVYMGSYAQSTNANLSYSGGNKYTSYMVNGSLANTGNIQLHKGTDENGTLRMSLNTTTADNKLNLQLTAGYMSSRSDMVPIDASGFIVDAPNAPFPFLPNGLINWADPDPDGPGLASNFNLTQSTITDNLLTNATLVYKPVTGLTLRAVVGYNDLTGTQLTGKPTTVFAPTNTDASQQTEANFNHYDIRSISAFPYAEYTRTLWGKGKLSVKAGGEIDNSETQTDNIQGVGFASDALLTDPAAGTTVSTTYNETPTRALGFYGIVNYVWDQMYVLDLNGRRDGSTQFGPDNRFGNFGSVAAAWIFSDENFIKQNLPFLSFGKLRGSTGIVGGDNVPSYAYLNTYQVINGIYDGAPGLSASTPADPNLEWEKDRDKEIGLDLGFLKDRIRVGASYYHNVVGNQLVTRPVSSVTGFSSYSLNSDAVIRLSGWEGTLSTINIKSNNFTWSTSFNISIPTSKLLRAPSLANINLAYIVGKPTTGVLLYKYAGVDPATGYFQFTNAKGSTQDYDAGTTNTFSLSSPTDQTQFLNTAPKFDGGITNSFRYKQFTLSVFVSFMDRVGENELAQSGMIFGYFDENASTEWLHRWQKPGDITNIPKVSTNLIADIFTMSTYANSTGGYTNASYARLQNLNLSYHLSKGLLKRSHLHDASIYLAGQNLLTISRFGGLDPENLNVGAIPPLRVFTGGINLSL